MERLPGITEIDLLHTMFKSALFESQKIFEQLAGQCCLCNHAGAHRGRVFLHAIVSHRLFVSSKGNSILKL